MGSLSDYCEKKWLDHIFNVNFTAPSTLYILLSDSDPLDDASGVSEPSPPYAYARQTIAFDAPATRKVENSALITFPQASGGSWGNITHWGICDHLSNTTFGTNVSLFAHGAFAAAKTVSDGKQATVAAQEVDIIIDAGAITTFLVHEMLDHIFRGNVYASPSTYMALLDTNGADGDTDPTAKEPAGNNYSRVQVNVNGGSSPTWDLATGDTPALITNTHLVQMPTPSGSWGTITDWGIVDAATVGNLLFYADLGGDEAIGDSDDVEFAIGAIDVTLA
jgi:hypothetical protein